MNLAQAPKSVKRFCAGAKNRQKPAKTATFMGGRRQTGALVRCLVGRKAVTRIHPLIMTRIPAFPGLVRRLASLLYESLLVGTLWLLAAAAFTPILALGDHAVLLQWLFRR